MKILLLGKDGQVGWELQRALAPLGDVIACNRHEADLEQPETLRQFVRSTAPSIVVNAAAYTAVDRAESEPERATRINAESVGVLAEEVKKLGGWLVHYSTDYVFDGNKDGAYLETDTTAPQSVYGESKRAGELAIEATACKHLILRTSWVFAARGNNFAKTMLRLAKDRDELKIVCDQIGAPTSAELIADITALALHRLAYDQPLAERASGTYHLVAGGETSWHGYAQFVIAEALRQGVSLNIVPERVLPIATAEYPLPAPRPSNSRLNTQKLRDTFGITLPAWQMHVQRVVTEIIQPGIL
ncbi:MAG: dTDP-4-dehydrorhamnose reductase [Pseudomonadota bacterium]|nr:dTDP-4-dehydrorhamnose reductase [Pseudomonadota bacterium]